MLGSNYKMQVNNEYIINVKYILVRYKQRRIGKIGQIIKEIIIKGS